MEILRVADVSTKFGITFQNEALLRQALAPLYVVDGTAQITQVFQLNVFGGNALLCQLVARWSMKHSGGSAVQAAKLAELLHQDKNYNYIAQALGFEPYQSLAGEPGVKRQPDVRLTPAQLLKAFVSVLLEDQSYELLERFFTEYVLPHISSEKFYDPQFNAWSWLYLLVQKTRGEKPTLHTEEVGLGLNKQIRAQVNVGSEEWGSAQAAGRSRACNLAAAQALLERFQVTNMAEAEVLYTRDGK